jgi:hypothetical protein
MKLRVRLALLFVFCVHFFKMPKIAANRQNKSTTGNASRASAALTASAKITAHPYTRQRPTTSTAPPSAVRHGAKSINSKKPNKYRDGLLQSNLDQSLHSVYTATFVRPDQATVDREKQERDAERQKKRHQLELKNQQSIQLEDDLDAAIAQLASAI